jgi:hypothetical protein
MLKFEIPKELAHLPISKGGYPIPFFVSTKDGEPDFVILSFKKQQICIEKKLCGVCGKKIHSSGFIYFISGPVGYKNRVSSDAGMHRVCAEFSLTACPHMYLEKAKRREIEIPPGHYCTNDDLVMLLDKPSEILLVKACKFKVMDLPHGGHVLRYSAVSAEKYIYVDGKLTKEIK